MNKQNHGRRSSLWYALPVVLFVLAAGVCGVFFGLKSGRLRRERIAADAVQSGVTSEENEAAESVPAAPMKTEEEIRAEAEKKAAAEAKASAEAEAEAGRTESMLLAMSEQARGEDAARIRSVIAAGVPDVVEYAASKAGKKSSGGKKKSKTR
jgi:hypothetical protein